MIPNYFDIAEFLIDPEMRDPAAGRVPVHVVQKIDAHHRPILNPIRARLDVPVIISKRSGYRTPEWEKARGRSGSSEHTFAGKGAVDVRSNKKLDQLLDLLIDSDYNRVCWYPHHGFIHCDFKGDDYQYFRADENSEWHFKDTR